MDEAEQLLKELLQKRRDGEFVDAEEGCQRTQEMIERKRAAIDTALEKAGQGRFVSSDAVNDWMDSWSTENELPTPMPDSKK